MWTGIRGVAPLVNGHDESADSNLTAPNDEVFLVGFTADRVLARFDNDGAKSGLLVRDPQHPVFVAKKQVNRVN